MAKIRLVFFPFGEQDTSNEKDAGKNKHNNGVGNCQRLVHVDHRIPQSFVHVVEGEYTGECLEDRRHGI